LIVLGMVLGTLAGWSGELNLGSLFGDKMVLQRDLPVRVWGWGEAGEMVAASIAGKKATGQVGKDGRWRLELDALAAGGPHELRVTSGGESVVCKDVLVGEVWICSGQSNMQMGYGGIPEIKKLVADSAGRAIRNFTVQQNVAFDPQNRCVGSWQDGPSGSAVAASFAVDLQAALNVPVAVILTCWGSSSIEGWMPVDLTETLPHFKAEMVRFEKEDRAKVAHIKANEQGKARWTRKDNIYLRTRPNILYNAMMHPLAPYSVRGLAWYQGEANSGSVKNSIQYGESLQVWSQRLRKEFENNELHILGVMLPGFGRIYGGSPSKELDSPAALSWAFFRESQLKLLNVPHTGIANTVDLGDVKNIHPKDKRPIGQRLALLAQRDAVGMKVVAAGPLYKSHKVEGKTVTVSFKDGAGLKTKDGEAPKGFWLCGDDKKWMPATARVDGASVVLESPGIAKPIAVRYAFAAMPQVNLVNGAGLPAYPFRTDSF
jgi:sialate O-acetylesterase